VDDALRGSVQEIWVVAGLVFDADGRVLIAQRPAGKVLAGRWEFPGGKVAGGETAHAAIVRELREEIAIEAGRAGRLMYYAAVYPERTIWLDVWVVEDWSGEPRGLDGQALAWVERGELHRHDILEADAPIVAALSITSPACGSGRWPQVG
jgi:8-oxo-dGTP diphosphatase